MQDKNGEFVGFEIDVAKRLAKDLGVELQLVPTKWAGIIPALMAGKFDVIIGSMRSRFAERAAAARRTGIFRTDLRDAVAAPGERRAGALVAGG